MLIALLLICWPLLELFVAFEVSQLIGVTYTVLLILLSVPVGIWAVRSQGRVVWRRLTDGIAAGRPPARAVLDGALVLIGGVLFILPGFVSDVFGALLLLPPSRAGLRRLLVRNFHGRFVRQMAGFSTTTPAYDVESTATDVESPRLGR
ncbi:MAG: FxsA family protein [Solirubrobacteraceae bacterium]